LPDGDDVVGEARKEVDVPERPVLAVLAVEEHRAGALDAGDGAIPKSHGAGDTGVEVGERGAGPGHVVGCAGVQDPARWVSIHHIVELGVDLLLQDMELRERRR